MKRLCSIIIMLSILLSLTVTSFAVDCTPIAIDAEQESLLAVDYSNEVESSGAFAHDESEQAVSAFTASDSSSSDFVYPRERYAKAGNHGMYRIVSGDAVTTYGTETNDTIIPLTQISEAGIYVNENERDNQEKQYFINTGNDVLLETVAVTFDLLNPDEMENLFEEYGVASDIQEDLRTASEKSIHENRDNAQAVLYTSNFPSKSRAMVSNHYTYKGAAVREDVVSYIDEEILNKDVCTGKSVLEVAGELATAEMYGEIISTLEDLDIPALAKTTITLFDKSASLLQAIKEYYDNKVFTAMHDDRIYFSTIYDKYQKYTYVNHSDGFGYQLGSRTMYVRFKMADITASLWVLDGLTPAGGGHREHYPQDASMFRGSYYTSSYTNPAKYAYAASVGGGVYSHEEELYWKLWKKYFYA